MKRMNDAEFRAKLATLPVWMQTICNEALNARDAAQKALTEARESQTPTPFYILKYGHGSKGFEESKTYINTDRIVVEWAGVKLIIDCNEHASRTKDGLELRYTTTEDTLGGEVSLIPKMFQQIELKRPERTDTVKRILKERTKPENQKEKT